MYHSPLDLRVEEVPLAALGPDELLVEVAWCGVCGSDLHTIIEGWGRPGTVGGHEWSGTVVAVGDDASGWNTGDRVVGGRSPTCGVCGPCRADRPSLCVERSTPGTEAYRGAFATHTVVGADAAVRVPDEVDLRAAALSEPLAVALHALTRSGVRTGDRVLVSGAGPIGALVIAALRARGVDEVVACEPNEGRRALATRVGASDVFRPEELAVPSMAEPMRLRDHPFDVAFECSGRAAAMQAALAQLGKGGTLCLVGAGIEAPRFDPNRILLNELVVTGAYEYDATGFPDALSLLASGAVPVDDLVEPGDVTLGGLLDACEALARGEIAGKVMVNPREA